MAATEDESAGLARVFWGRSLACGISGLGKLFLKGCSFEGSLLGATYTFCTTARAPSGPYSHKLDEAADVCDFWTANTTGVLLWKTGIFPPVDLHAPVDRRYKDLGRCKPKAPGDAERKSDKISSFRGIMS